MYVCVSIWRKGADIELEVKKTMKDKELLYVNERVCMIYIFVHYMCIGGVTHDGMVDIENP